MVSSKNRLPEECLPDVSRCLLLRHMFVLAVHSLFHLNDANVVLTGRWLGVGRPGLGRGTGQGHGQVGAESARKGALSTIFTPYWRPTPCVVAMWSLRMLSKQFLRGGRHASVAVAAGRSLGSWLSSL